MIEMSSLTQPVLASGQMLNPWYWGWITTLVAVASVNPAPLLNTTRTSVPGAARLTTWPWPSVSTQWAALSTCVAETIEPEQMKLCATLRRQGRGNEC